MKNCAICHVLLKECDDNNNYDKYQFFKCENNHYSLIYHNNEKQSDLCVYGKYTIQRIYHKKELKTINLYLPFIEGLHGCISYNSNDIRFDPLKPDNILNKLKTIVVFS